MIDDRTLKALANASPTELRIMINNAPNGEFKRAAIKVLSNHGQYGGNTSARTSRARKNISRGDMTGLAGILSTKGTPEPTGTEGIPKSMLNASRKVGSLMNLAKPAYHLPQDVGVGRPENLRKPTYLDPQYRGFNRPDPIASGLGLGRPNEPRVEPDSTGQYRPYRSGSDLAKQMSSGLPPVAGDNKEVTAPDIRGQYRSYRGGGDLAKMLDDRPPSVSRPDEPAIPMQRRKPATIEEEILQDLHNTYSDKTEGRAITGSVDESRARQLNLQGKAKQAEMAAIQQGQDMSFMGAAPAGRGSVVQQNFTPQNMVPQAAQGGLSPQAINPGLPRRPPNMTVPQAPVGALQPSLSQPTALGNNPAVQPQQAQQPTTVGGDNQVIPNVPPPKPAFETPAPELAASQEVSPAAKAGTGSKYEGMYGPGNYPAQSFAGKAEKATADQVGGALEELGFLSNVTDTQWMALAMAGFSAMAAPSGSSGAQAFGGGALAGLNYLHQAKKMEVAATQQAFENAMLTVEASKEFTPASWKSFQEDGFKDPSKLRKVADMKKATLLKDIATPESFAKYLETGDVSDIDAPGSRVFMHKPTQTLIQESSNGDWKALSQPPTPTKPPADVALIREILAVNGLVPGTKEYADEYMRLGEAALMSDPIIQQMLRNSLAGGGGDGTVPVSDADTIQKSSGWFD